MYLVLHFKYKNKYHTIIPRTEYYKNILFKGIERDKSQNKYTPMCFVDTTRINFK